MLAVGSIFPLERSCSDCHDSYFDRMVGDESGTPIDDLGIDPRMDSRVRARGFGANALATAVSFACSAAAAVLLGRSLGPSGFTAYGLCSVALAFGTAIGLFSLGIHLAAELRSNESDVAVAEGVLRSAFVTAVPTATLVVAIGIAIGGSARVLGVLVALEIVLSIPQVLRSVLDVRMRQVESARVTVMSRLVWLSSVLVVLSLPGPTHLEWVLVGRLLAAGADSLLISRLARVSVVASLHGPWVRRDVLSHVKRSAPLAGAALLSDAVYRVDQPILERSAGAAATGRYVAAARVADLIGAMAPLIANVFFPGLLELHRNGESKALKKTTEEHFAVTLLLCGAVCAVIAANSETVVRALFGSAYAGAGPALAWLAVAEWATLFTSVFNTSLMAAGRRNVLVGANAFGTVVNLLALLLLVRSHGPVGAAAASLIAYSSVALVMLLFEPPSVRSLLAKLSVAGSAAFGLSFVAAHAGGILVGSVCGLGVHTVAISLLFPGVRIRIAVRSRRSR